MADYTPVTWNPGDTGSASQFTALSAALDEEELFNDIQKARLDCLDSYITTMPRWAVGGTLGLTSGTVFWTHFTADRNMTVSAISVRTGSTAAAATPTLIRMGLYSESVVGDLTQIAATPNDTTLFATTNTIYTKSFSAITNVTMGNRYAVAVIVVSATTMPSLNTFGSGPGSAEVTVAPKMQSSLASQSDLPSSIVANSLATTGGVLYARLG